MVGGENFTNGSVPKHVGSEILSDGVSGGGLMWCERVLQKDD